jgi:hypothetical protein
MENTTQTQKSRKYVTGVVLPPEVQAQVAAIAENREWSMAQTSRYLIKLGLEKLKEIASQQSDISVNA